MICCCVFSSLKAERIMRLNTSCEIIPWEKTLTVFQRRPTDVCFCNCGAAIRMYVAFFLFLFFVSDLFLTLCLQEFLEYEPAVHVSLMVKAASQSCSRLGFIKDLRNEVCMLLLRSLWRVCWYIWWQHVCGCSRFLKNKQNYCRGGFFGGGVLRKDYISKITKLKPFK